VWANGGSLNTEWMLDDAGGVVYFVGVIIVSWLCLGDKFSSFRDNTTISRD
jgi:hypothetical protein